jgi:hypothetical protein
MCKGCLTIRYANRVAVSVDRRPAARGRAFCADVSHESSEALAATASRVDHWILVEYRGLWDRDVLGGSLLSAKLKAHLRSQLAELGHARLLFVKKPERRSYGRRQLYFGSSRPGEERFFALEFDRHDDLIGFDFVGALGGGETPGVPVDHPLLVVCTHGKRDRCCAKHGRPLYDALRRDAESGWVWQSTHVGGDRFAGNVVVLPEGLFYGRVSPEETSALMDEHSRGKLLLERYRGRSAFSFPVQAADHALRVEDGLVGIDELAYAGGERVSEGLWRVRFRNPDGVVHELEVVEELGDEPVYLTCGAATPRRARRFRATARRFLGP